MIKKRKKSTKKPKTKRARGKTWARLVERQRKGEKKRGKQAEYFSASPKERGERGRSGQSYSERTWGEQGEYVSVTPKERQTNGERKAQSTNRERRRTKRTKKDY